MVMKLNSIFIFSVMGFVLTACSSTKPTSGTTLESTVTLTWQNVNEPGSGGFSTAAAMSLFSSQRILLGGDMLGLG
jgi:ABC-type glycerol-3-phosphate transport system substrate-binding protein